MTPAEQAQVQSAINLLLRGSAYETPFAEDVLLRLAPAAESSGFLSAGGFMDAAKLNPISTLLRWLLSLISPATPGLITTTPPGLEGQLGVMIQGNIPGLVSFADRTPKSVAGFDIELTTTLQSISLPEIVAITSTSTQAGSLYVLNNSALVTVEAPKLVSVDGAVTVTSAGALQVLNLPKLQTVRNVDVNTNPGLKSFLLPSLVTISGAAGVNCSSNPLLTTVDMSKWVPTDGSAVTFTNDALDAASVEMILHRCNLATVTTCFIDLTGGTNAGFSVLTGQGQSDYFDLLLLGNTITINP